MQKTNERETEEIQTLSAVTWVPINEIQQSTGADLNAIRSVVRRAYQSGQDWVRMEPYPTPQSRPRWLVNTASIEYKNHKKRWLKKR